MQCVLMVRTQCSLTLLVIDCFLDAGLVPLPLTVTPIYVYDLPTVAMHASEVAIRPAGRSISVAVVVRGNKLASRSIGGMHRSCVHVRLRARLCVQATRQ